MARLEAIRLARLSLAEGRYNPRAERRFNDERANRAYEAAFRDARVGTPDEDPAAVGARVAASAVRAPVVSALDDWAACAADGRRQEWVLRVARRADPDAWRDQARDPAVWADPAALNRLAGSAPVADQPLSLLLALGERLQAVGGDATGFLSRVRRAAPDDFWVNLVLGNAFREYGAADAAANCYQQAIKARKDSVVAFNNLGLVSFGWNNLPSAIERYQQALTDRPHVRPGVQQPRPRPETPGVAPGVDPAVPEGR